MTTFTKVRSLVATGLFLGVLGASSVTNLISNNSVAAASNCDKVNIVYCGLDSNYVTSFQNYYTKNVSGHKASPTVNKDYTDLQTVYKWAGVTAAEVNSMNSTNTKVGTLYKDGRIVVDGKTVGTDAWVSARFTNGNGFTQIAGNVYARKTTTSFANASAKVIVYMQNDQMVFAIMTDCANAVKATPVKKIETPAPKPVTPAAPATPVTTTPAPKVQTVAAPKELPQTGPADMFGIFSGVAMAGASAHRIMTKRRLSK
jgi:hypothetical protein